MPRPKSIIKRVEIDKAQKAHDCQHNSRHRLKRGDRRLKIWNSRSAEHYCLNCALEIVERDIKKLKELKQKLEAE